MKIHTRENKHLPRQVQHFEGGYHQPCWYAFQRLMHRKFFIVLFVNFCITMLFAYSGPERLEPIIIGWFYFPIPIFAWAGRSDYPVILPMWTIRNRLASFCIAMCLMFIIVWIAWPLFYWLDINLLHGIRTSISAAVRMPDQTGFFFIFGILLGIVAVWNLFHDFKYGHRDEAANNVYA